MSHSIAVSFKVSEVLPTSLLFLLKSATTTYGKSSGFSISSIPGTNRTPFQCLARYQRSLNASIIKREWTEEEDNKLRVDVEVFGGSNWQVIMDISYVSQEDFDATIKMLRQQYDEQPQSLKDYKI
nr:snRNA-activating protein complex subunit 4 homolog [Ipomoea batatas]